VKVGRHETEERGHRRDERRAYFVCPVPQGLPDAARWPELKAIGPARRRSAVRRGSKAKLVEGVGHEQPEVDLVAAGGR
jgi:hypothetical protein